ncbi:hypothetical protein AAVH_22894, partial [Aphelenchoides avenae]
SKNLVACSRAKLIELEQKAKEVLSDLENNNLSDGRSIAAALRRQNELAQALGDAGNSSLKQSPDADRGLSAVDAESSLNSVNAQEHGLALAERSDDSEPGSSQEGSSTSSNGSSRRRSTRFKSISQEEQWRIDLSMVVDESHLYRVRGIVGDGLASRKPIEPGKPVVEYR